MPIGSGLVPHLLLLLLFVLTVAHLVTLKLCADRIDHRTAPLFISGWTVIGLAVSYPLFGDLLGAGLAAAADRPWLFALVLVKGGLLYLILVASQDLMKLSLSSRHYVTPLAVGGLALANSFLGESLTPGQWFSAIGLCAVSFAFLALGHAADLGRAGRVIYLKLVALAILLGMIDQVVLSHMNWYAFLALSNIALLAFALMAHRGDLFLLRTAAFHPLALLAGSVYAVTELVKFYQMVTINPVTAVVMIQSLTKPVVLLLSAWIWKERTVREQVIWGLLAFALACPMFLWR